MSAPTQQEINRLVALFGARRFAELEQAAQALVARTPQTGFAWKALAVAQKMQGKESLHAAQEAARLLPDDAEAQQNLDVTQREHGMLDEAIASYRRALAANPSFVDAHANLANALTDRGQLEEALSHCRVAATLAPHHVFAWLNLGYLLGRMGQTQESIQASRQAIALMPGNASAHNNLANALRDAGSPAEAETHYKEALQLQPDYVPAWVSLAALYNDLGRSEEAAACCRKALALHPNLPEAHNNLADAGRELGQFDMALAAYTQALALRPDHPQTHYNMSLLLLTLGRYEEAWPHHEWRTDPRRGKAAVRLPPLPSRPWRGESLEGRHILLCHEQGYGDTIQFVRYAALLKQQGATRVSLVCPPQLAPLMKSAYGIDDVYDAYEALPPHDDHVLTMSLPHCFATRVGSIPSQFPYLVSDAARVENWRTALPHGFKVGLAWQGAAHHKNDRHRSLAHLNTLAPLWRVPDASFVSLQKGRGEDEAQASSMPLIALGHRIDDFADMAAIVDQLDLVVTVDTAVAHLAGALGKPCWILLPAHGTDWRWLRERDDTPWYPGTTRLYRQSQAGDWQMVVERVAADLAKLPR